jgi:CRP-like cAMP-binding protein
MNEAPARETRVLEALSRVPVFSQLDDKNQRKLAKLCVLKSFQPGDIILEEATMALGLYVVTSGRVEMYKSSNGARISLGEIEAGGVIGQIALLDEQPRSASAVALDATECLLLTRDSFETLVKRDPQIAWCLVPAVVGRVRELESRAVATELQLEELRHEATPESGAVGAAPPEKTEEAETQPDAEDEDEKEEDDDVLSDLESAFYKMMRMQYGLMAGAAKGVTEMSRLMETFLDSVADETDLKTSEDWRDMLEKIPDAMVTATREVMDKGEKVPDDMVDAYHRYSDSDSDK